MSLDAADKSVCATFDRIAPQYDQQWTDTAIGRAQREQVWRRVDGVFQQGDRILDVGCGTGVDAAHFAEQGVAVHAIDPSPAMIQHASRRGGFTTQALPAEEIASLAGPFDGAISNFGALNCVADLSRVAQALATIVRPGGRVAICTMGRFCLWESLHYLFRGQFRKAFRRWRGSAPSSLGTIHYPSISELRRTFSAFELVDWTGIGLFVPPSYVPLPERLVGWCAVLDRAMARIPILRAMADHRLLMLVKR